MTAAEYVTYKAPAPIQNNNPTSNIAKTLELQSWILDPSSRPYPYPYQPVGTDKKGSIITRSAGASEVEAEATIVPDKDKRLTIEKQLELRRMILGD